MDRINKKTKQKKDGQKTNHPKQKKNIVVGGKYKSKILTVQRTPLRGALTKTNIRDTTGTKPK